MTTLEELNQLERDLLRSLYETSCRSNGLEVLALSAWATERGVEWSLVERTFKKLSAKDWIEKPFMSWSARLTALGIAQTELAGEAPAELAAQNNLARERILLLLGPDQAEGHRALRPEALGSELGLDQNEVLRNALFLLHLGLLEDPRSGYFQATTEGLDAAVGIRGVKARQERFEKLKAAIELTPQERGHELESLLEGLANEDGWGSERNVRGHGEEQDLVLNQQREYYLLESRWLKDRVQPRAIREFANRVEARAGVRGLFVSMSGFTEAAVDETKDQLRNRVILLFGPEDVGGLVRGERGFTALLNAKYHGVVARREILVE